MAEVVSAHGETDESRDIPPWCLINTTPRERATLSNGWCLFRTKRKKCFMRMRMYLVRELTSCSEVAMNPIYCLSPDIVLQ